MTILRVGSNQKYADNFASAFGKPTKGKTAQASEEKKVVKKSPKKAAGKSSTKAVAKKAATKKTVAKKA